MSVWDQIGPFCFWVKHLRNHISKSFDEVPVGRQEDETFRLLLNLKVWVHPEKQQRLIATVIATPVHHQAMSQLLPRHQTCSLSPRFIILSCCWELTQRQIESILDSCLFMFYVWWLVRKCPNMCVEFGFWFRSQNVIHSEMLKTRWEKWTPRTAA